MPRYMCGVQRTTLIFGSKFFLLPCASSDRKHAIRLDSKYLYLLSQLAGLVFNLKSFTI